MGFISILHGLVHFKVILRNLEVKDISSGVRYPVLSKASYRVRSNVE